MRCQRCRQKFQLDKASERCSSIVTAVCPRCTLRDTELHRCDINCQGRLIKEINYHPLTSGFMGFGSMAQVSTTTEECLPSIFRFIYAQVHEVDISLVEMNRLSVKIRMRLNGNKNLSKQVNAKEEWKNTHLLATLEEYSLAGMEHAAPVLTISPDAFLRIKPETLKLKLAGKDTLVAMSDRHEYMATPVSEPPPDHHQFELSSKPVVRGNYSYYGGKFSSIYAPLNLDEEYEFTFEIEAANPTYMINFLFPYRYVDLEKMHVESVGGNGLLAVIPLYARAKPMNANILTPEFEYKITRSYDEPPITTQASPWRKTPLIIAPRPIKFHPVDNTGAYPIRLDEYELISVQFGLAYIEWEIPDKLLVQSKVTERSIPVRTYEQMQKLPAYEDFLIEFDLTNIDNSSERTFEIESYIADYTEKAINKFTLPPMNSQRGSRVVINQCPTLKEGVLDAMDQPVNTEVTYEIYELRDDERIPLQKSSKPVHLLSNEQIIWSLRDVTGGALYNLEPTIAGWIQPDKIGNQLDDIITAAAKYHKDSKLTPYGNGMTLDEITEDIKALYNYLNNDYGIAFSDHDFQYGDPVNAQRILTAKQVLDAKGGVCIDLVILFATLMDRLGINPLIYITEKHAVLGWGDKKSVNTTAYLETEALGKKNSEGSFISFDDASLAAKDYVKNSFMFRNETDFIEGLGGRLGSVVVDLKEAREEGVKKSS
jgi:hypothetical protein